MLLIKLAAPRGYWGANDRTRGGAGAGTGDPIAVSRSPDGTSRAAAADRTRRHRLRHRCEQRQLPLLAGALVGARTRDCVRAAAGPGRWPVAAVRELRVEQCDHRAARGVFVIG